MTWNPDPTHLKIAYLGGGSRGWAHILMNDLALCPDLSGEVRLYDIDLDAARLNERLGMWLQDQPGVQSRWQYRAVEHIEQALRGADFVFISIQPGTLEMMAHEVAVAEKYGLFFPVGDTTGAPGLMRGLRSAIHFDGFACDIAEYCPEAWVINYTNPMTVCTRTLTRAAPELKVFGCCHEVFGTQHILAELAREWYGLAAEPAREQIRVNVLGINHFTWLDSARYEGSDLLARLREHLQQPGVLREYAQAEVEATGDWFADFRQIKFALFQRFGLLAAAGDRHLAEFVPGFTRSPEELFRWGVIRTPVAWRIQRYAEARQMAEAYLSGQKPLELVQTGEEMVAMLKALLGMGDLMTNVNLENSGQISNLPARAVVETNALFSRDSVRPLAAGALPAGVHGLVARHVENQEMIVEAALARDAEMAFQAVFSDPTTGLPIDRAYAMFQEIGLPEGLW
ncbi:MAG TPA: alpha-glucosidase/alpha-galactosidase [Anaerolinea sp.]|nr:alpha-glucosidase/alpha-galactosidase [Anaerolinea sp.]